MSSSALALPKVARQQSTRFGRLALVPKAVVYGFTTNAATVATALAIGTMSVRELNANISRALALVEAGDTIDITKNGVVIVEMRPKKARRELNPIWKADFDYRQTRSKVVCGGVSGC